MPSALLFLTLAFISGRESSRLIKNPVSGWDAKFNKG